MEKISRLLGLLFIGGTIFPTLTSCRTNGFKVGLLCLHGQTSTYDNNFINAFLAACKNKGLSEDEYEIRTDVAEDYNKIYTAATEWAEDGYKAVFADSFGHEKGVLPVAKQYPNTQFYHATGTQAHTEKLTNYHNAFASIYEGRFLAGVVAGMRMVKDIEDNKYSNEEAKIGYVGAYNYAEVISGYTSFYLGACYVFDQYANTVEHPKISKRPTMEVTYTSSWYNYIDENASAKSLIDRGCKLISQHADSFGAPQACADRDIPNVCYNISTEKQMPETYLAASKINWQPYFEMMIDEAKDPTKKVNLDTTLNLENTGVQILELGLGKNIAPGTEEMLNQIIQQLEEKTLRVFDCSTFTVTINETRNKFINAKIDDAGHLINFQADVDDDGTYVGETEAIYYDAATNITYFNESDPTLRSAPYFNCVIDGITELN